MTTPSVWTEVQPTAAIYRDCCWCSILMVLIAGGHTAFPLGAYTHLERRAFRGTDQRDNFAGPVEHAKSRYGVTVHSPTAMGPTALRAALQVKGKAWAIAGRLANFPPGHTLRRYSPTFIGFHAITYIPSGNGFGTWFDPLAPMHYPGQAVSVSQVVDIFCQGNYPNDARYLELDELKEDDVAQTSKATITPFPDGWHTMSIPVGGRIDAYDLGGLVKTQTFPNGSSFAADATVFIKQDPDPKKVPNGTFRRAANGIFGPPLGEDGNGLYILPAQVTDKGPINPPAPPITQGDVDKAAATSAAAVAAAAVSEAKSYTG